MGLVRWRNAVNYVDFNFGSLINYDVVNAEKKNIQKEKIDQ
jgi:hypothetical protein